MTTIRCTSYSLSVSRRCRLWHLQNEGPHIHVNGHDQHSWHPGLHGAHMSCGPVSAPCNRSMLMLAPACWFYCTEASAGARGV